MYGLFTKHLLGLFIGFGVAWPAQYNVVFALSCVTEYVCREKGKNESFWVVWVLLVRLWGSVVNLRGNSQEIFSSQGWKDILQKTVARTSVELGAQESFIKASGVYTSSWTEASPNILLVTASQGFLKAGSWEHFCKITGFGFRILQYWICLFPVLDLPLPKDVFELPLVHRRSLQRFPHLGQSVPCKIFFILIKWNSLGSK